MNTVSNSDPNLAFFNKGWCVFPALNSSQGKRKGNGAFQVEMVKKFKHEKFETELKHVVNRALKQTGLSCLILSLVF